MSFECSNPSIESRESTTTDRVESIPVLEDSLSLKENRNSMYSAKWGSKSGSSSTTASSSSSSSSSPVSVKSNSKVRKVTVSAKPLETQRSFIRGRPSACVFVASLRSNMLDDELCVSVNNHFKQWGQLSTVKVLRDTSNRPYAFVQYLNEKDSKLAIQKGHNSILDGRSIRCEAAKVNRTIFITSPLSLSVVAVETKLSKFGEIEELIPSNTAGQCYKDAPNLRGYKNWYCKYVYRDDAIKAYANLTEEGAYEVEWAQNVDKSKTVSFKEDTGLSTKVVNKPRFDKFSIFIGQLSAKITEAELRERFQRHGAITSLHLIKKRENVFAFITFKDESSAASSVEVENHAMLSGKTMHVQYREVQSSGRDPRGARVPLAPPPLHVGKRESNQPRENFYASSSKPKFNGRASNVHNRGQTNSKIARARSWKNNEEPPVKTSFRPWQASQLELKSDKGGNVGEPATQMTQRTEVPAKKLEKKEDLENTVPNKPKENMSVPNYPAPPNSAFPLFYYVPAENVSYTPGALQNSYYNVYPPYYHLVRPHSQFERGTINGSDGSSSDFAPTVHRPPSYGMPNFIYYPSEGDIKDKRVQ